ncbi:MAG: hypothetical protein U1F11_00445 [Steroidobacteraceae bacterium]
MRCSPTSASSRTRPRGRSRARCAPEIDPATHVFSVGQYRQTLVPYLGRTVDLVEYRGELDLGLRRDPASTNSTKAGFLAHWRQESDAVAFIEPRDYAKLAAAGMDGRIVADDGASIVVRRR